MDMFDFAGMLFGGSRTAPDATTVTATGAGASADGEVGITLDADVTPAEDTGVDGDTDQTIIDLPTSPDVNEGDELIVTLVGDGPLKTPVVTANPGSGDRMRTLVNAAQTVANAAQEVAEAVNQHFFSDTNGIHVTEATQEDWDVNHSGANVLINSIGQLFMDGLNNLLTLTTENGARALTIWDGLGNTADNIRAIIGETIQLGEGASKHLSIDSDSVDLMDGTTALATFGADETHLGMAGSGTLYMADDKTKLESRSWHWDVTGADRQSTELSTTMKMPSDDDSYTDSRLSFSHSILDGIYDPAYATDTWSTLSLEATACAGDINHDASLDLRATLSGSVINVDADQIRVFAANGENSYSTPAGTVLWSASSGWQMAANVTATLSHNVSTCPSGIVLHWQAYANNATQDYDHVYTFIPKQHVTVSNGKGVVCQLANGGFGYVGTKYVYVSDSGITGHSSNTATGTASGITYANNHWVLTQVISA